MKRKTISFTLVVALVIGLLSSYTVAFADSSTAGSHDAEIMQISESISIEAPQAFAYVEEAIGETEMLNTISKYNEAFPDDGKAYSMLKNNLESVYDEVVANNFTDEQAAALFVSAANLETGNAEITPMVFSRTIPDFAPVHSNEMVAEKDKITDTAVNRSTEPKSSRSSYETGGVGYEVKSTLGYNKSTAFVTAGACNITATSGKAGYIFYTIYSGGNYQDLGIGYFGGKWQAFVSGYWTNWGTANVNINPGDYLYYKLWIDSNNKINFQILDGNNFNNILFQNSYTTWNQIPANGSGVGFNKQITLVDTASNPNSGLYLNNSYFKDAYLYNSSTTARFSSSNTNSSRRGEFGCTWASDAKVTVHSYTAWSAEHVSIQMN